MSADTGALATPGPQVRPDGTTPLRVQILTRLQRRKLDRQLAAGAGPNARPLLRERARQLLTDEARRSIAESLRRVLDDASSPPQQFSSRVPIAREAIRDARRDLEEVIEHLNAPSYLCPQGIAQLSLLLTEGTSPLFGPAAPARQLRWSLQAALEGLDGGPQSDKAPADLAASIAVEVAGSIVAARSHIERPRSECRRI